MTETKSKTYATQKFYTTKLALQVQVSSNGIFFDVASALPDTDRFNWDAKSSVKFSISEICNMLSALEAFRNKGIESYTELAQNLFGIKYKNMQFIHINRKENQVRTGLNVYNNNLSFIIVNQKEEVNINFPILASEKIRFEKFLNFVISMSFQKNL
ncbi:MAG: hypothetical protein H7263_14630 [Candidatus Sericytochromatia bacterium]|nr:hypothetical protein [Candidatus Sericytochromatia bacterium]